MVKYKSHSKKVFLTISEKGMSKRLFFSSGVAVNGEIYSTECRQEVAAFIHAGENVVFWLALASVHLAKRSLQDHLIITVAPKNTYPPNIS